MVLSQQLAEVPPKGWNSWDGYEGTLNEAELMTLAASWAEIMLPHGYDTLTIDEFWYPDADKPGSLDAYGRAVVDESKWPSAAGGKGFKPVADKLHALGLKIGIHVMAGIPKEAMNPSAAGASAYRVFGRPNVSVASLSDGSWCPWNAAWGRVNMSKPGAQAYFDSIYTQYADWGIDFIKNDCVFGQNLGSSTFSNIEATRLAMDKTGHPFVYSLSPGFAADSPLVRKALPKTAPLVNMYRMTSDWHGWDGPVDYDGRYSDSGSAWPNHFELAGSYSDYIGAAGAHGKSWLDLDMLNPFADLESMRMQQTLWAMARSPLIFGGKAEDITAANPQLGILTNPRVLAVSDHSSKNRQVTRLATEAVWAAEITEDSSLGTADGVGSLYVALFKLAHDQRQGDGDDSLVEVTFAVLGIPDSVTTANVTDVWTGAALGAVHKTVAAKLSPCSNTSKAPCSALLMLNWWADPKAEVV